MVVQAKLVSPDGMAALEEGMGWSMRVCGVWGGGGEIFAQGQKNIA